MMHWWYGGMGVWGYLVMAVSMAAFWVLIVVLVVALARSVSRNQRRTTDAHTQHRDPEEILAERFARGELTEREYQDRLAVLRDNARPRTGD